MTVAAQPNHPGSSTTQPDEHPSRVSSPESTEERPSAPFPVIDDDLLRNVVEVADRVHGLPGGFRRVGAAFLGDPVMQRLREAWTAEEHALWYGEYEAATRKAFSVARERDAALAELGKEQGAHVSTVEDLNEARRDHASAAERFNAVAKDLTDAMRVLKTAGLLVEADADQPLRVPVERAVTEVARLRASLPVLPDVGPVERVNLGIRKALRCEVSVPDDAGLSAFVWSVTVIPYAAAAATKMLALLDAEAADTSSDDAEDPREALVWAWFDDENRDAADLLTRLDAHRAARISEEQNRG